MQARQLRRARGEPQILRQAPGALLRQTPSYERPFLLRVSSTGPAYVWCGAYVFPRQAPGSPQILRQASGSPQILRHPPPMSGARGAWPYCLCVVLCFAYLDRPRLCALLTRGAVRCGALPSTGPGVRCLTFDRARGASTAPAYLLCALRCFAYFDSPRGAYVLCPALPHFDSPRLCALLCLALLRQPPGVPGLTSYVLCSALLACFACFVLLCFALLCLRVFYTY